MKKDNQERVGAVIVAAGESQRMGGMDKMQAQLGGRPLLARVIDTFQACAPVNQIVVVVNRKSEAWCQKLIAEGGWSKVSDICPGGKRRQGAAAGGSRAEIHTPGIA